MPPLEGGRDRGIFEPTNEFVDIILDSMRGATLINIMFRRPNPGPHPKH